jgi:hypothetical protein
VRAWQIGPLPAFIWAHVGRNSPKSSVRQRPKLQFNLTGVPGFAYTVEASTNLSDWLPLSTNVSPFTFTDADATNFPARFYRSVYVP